MPSELSLLTATRDDLRTSSTTPPHNSTGDVLLPNGDGWLNSAPTALESFYRDGRLRERWVPPTNWAITQAVRGFGGGTQRVVQQLTSSTSSPFTWSGTTFTGTAAARNTVFALFDPLNIAGGPIAILTSTEASSNISTWDVNASGKVFGYNGTSGRIFNGTFGATGSATAVTAGTHTAALSGIAFVTNTGANGLVYGTSGVGTFIALSTTGGTTLSTVVNNGNTTDATRLTTTYPDVLHAGHRGNTVYAWTQSTTNTYNLYTIDAPWTAWVNRGTFTPPVTVTNPLLQEVGESLLLFGYSTATNHTFSGYTITVPSGYTTARVGIIFSTSLVVQDVAAIYARVLGTGNPITAWRGSRDLGDGGTWGLAARMDPLSVSGSVHYLYRSDANPMSQAYASASGVRTTFFTRYASTAPQPDGGFLSHLDQSGKVLTTTNSSITQRASNAGVLQEVSAGVSPAPLQLVNLSGTVVGSVAHITNQSALNIRNIPGTNKYISVSTAATTQTYPTITGGGSVSVPANSLVVYVYDDSLAATAFYTTTGYTSVINDVAVNINGIAAIYDAGSGVTVLDVSGPTISVVRARSVVSIGGSPGTNLHTIAINDETPPVIALATSTGGVLMDTARNGTYSSTYTPSPTQTRRGITTYGNNFLLGTSVTATLTGTDFVIQRLTSASATPTGEVLRISETQSMVEGLATTFPTSTWPQFPGVMGAGPERAVAWILTDQYEMLPASTASYIRLPPPSTAFKWWTMLGVVFNPTTGAVTDYYKVQFTTKQTTPDAENTNGGSVFLPRGLTGTRTPGGGNQNIMVAFTCQPGAVTTRTGIIQDSAVSLSTVVGTEHILAFLSGPLLAVGGWSVGSLMLT